MCLRDPPLLSPELSRRREAVVSALGRVERAVASFPQARSCQKDRGGSM
jgi:uncharacterized membrane protein